MRKYVLYFFSVIALTVTLSACKKEKFEEESSFFRVYNELQGNRNYEPLSIERTSDNGFVVLAAYDGWRILVMKLDAVGGFVWKYELPQTHVNAVPTLVKHQDGIYFVCMDHVSLDAYVMRVDEGGAGATVVGVLGGVTYPVAAYSNGTSFYVQNYNRLSYETGIHLLNSSLSGVAQSGYVSINTSVEAQVVNHINFTGDRLPFALSSTPENDKIAAIGFYNYSFALMYFNPDLSFAGVYNGASNFSGNVNSILPLGSNTFALARRAGTLQYYAPTATLNPATIEVAENIGGTGVADVNPANAVVIKKITIGGVNFLAYGATTANNQIQVSFWDEQGNLRGKKFIGKNTNFILSDMIATEDGGLLVLGKLKLFNSYNRIAISKFTQEEMEAVL